MTATKSVTHTHTPGPWRVDSALAKDGGRFGIAILGLWSPDGDVTATTSVRIADLPPGEVDDETQANARLIAAAPELANALAVLETAARRYASGLDSNATYVLKMADKARVVLAAL